MDGVLIDGSGSDSACWFCLLLITLCVQKEKGLMFTYQKYSDLINLPVPRSDANLRWNCQLMDVYY